MSALPNNVPTVRQGRELSTDTDALEEPRSVCDLVDRWARRRPNHTAILFEERRISYQELNDAASRIACLLARKHVQPGDVIPVLATRTCEMVASFLGVLKAGACYVPIDVEAWGEDRIASTLERVSARVVVNLGTSSFPGYDIISRNEIKASFEPAVAGKDETKEELSHVMIKPNDLVYIVFTSGTTSKPKGVMIPHRALLNYVQQGDEEAPFNTNPLPEDKSLLTFSPGFDAGTGVIFSTLCNGAQLMVASISDFESCATRATIIAITPSMLSAIHDIQACSQVRTLILGGEPPHARLIEKWTAPGRRIYNGYGPTETTIGSLMGKVESSKPITLGRPMSNSRVILLDGDIESDYGEICLTGPGLAVGYYQDEALTAQKFVYWQGERMYRTGDFARRTEHGLEYAGRADSFVKNRGFLVNIDSQVIPILLQTEAHMGTAFMYRDHLVAFVTPESIDTRALRQTLSENHDAFLVPDQIRAVPILPLTANGKADNRALRQLLEAEGSDGDDIAEEDDDLHKRPKIETLKMAISAATSLSLSEVLDGSSFSELGGNSLAALKVVSYLRRRQLKLAIGSLFNIPDLKAVSDVIEDDLRGNGTKDLPKTANRNDINSEEELTVGPMTALQVKMIQASLKTPGANTMLLRIYISHPETTFDKASLREAWYQVLRRHSIFRTTFLLRDELQQVKPDLDMSWSEEETTAEQLSDVLHTRSLRIREKILQISIQGETFIPVNILHLVTVPGVGSTLLFSAHHAQADGWSLSIILDEVQTALLGNKSSLTRRPPQFINVALAQSKQQSDPEGISFWEGILERHSALPIFNLPKPPSDQSPYEWTKSMQLDLGIKLVGLEQGARLLRVAPSTLLYAAWGIVLSNYMSSDRVAFGAVFSGRNLIDVPGVDHAVGPLLNTVPFPIEFEAGQTIADAVSHINSRLFQMLEFQWSAVEAMAAMTSESINGTLQTLVVTEYDLPTSKGSLWTIERNDLMEFGLSLLLERGSGGQHADSENEEDQDLQARILFDSSKYAQSSISKLLTHFKNALSGLVNPQHTHVWDVRSHLMEEQEKLALLHPPPAFSHEIEKDLEMVPRTIKDVFEAAASKWPDLCAVETIYGDMFSYRELDEASNKVGRELRQCLQERSPKDTVVGVLSDGSLYWVIAILAVLKAGCICCPIDVSLPTQRIKIIVEQSRASIFLAANRACVDNFNLGDANHNAPSIVVDEFLQSSPDTPATQLRTVTEVEDIIYLVFTSGSTGVPKGVPLHNLSILNLLEVPDIRLFAKPGRRISQLCALGFDMVLVEVFASLCYGGTLVLKDSKDPFEHLKHVNAIVATPSLLSACSPEDYGELDAVLLAGEALPQTLADTWATKVQTFLNLYGPSECGCVSSGTRLRPGSNVSIGRAIPGLDIYILDNQRCMVPQGITGEIYISGVQVTRGYWGNTHEERTKSLFIPNPFSSNPTHRIMYRTGDLGFWNEEMNISYIGRVDNMVKVRGFRVELEEVENALLAADRVKVQSAAAIAVSSGSGGDDYFDGSLHIVGLVTPADVDIAALRAKIAVMLPSYARPSQLLAVSELPKTANLKLDREKLKDLVLATQAQPEYRGPGKYEGEGERESDKLSPTESLIAGIWKKLLGLRDGVRIRKDDDFLALGGNSVLAIRAARSIAASIGHNIPVALLVRESVLERLAKAIDQPIVLSPPLSSATGYSFSSHLSMQKSDSADGNQPLLDPSRPLPLSYLEYEMFQAHMVSTRKSAFNTTAQFVLSGPVDLKILVEAFTALVQENPILRARYFMSEEHAVRVISANVTEPQFYRDELDSQRLQALVNEPFDLAKDQLARVVFWEKAGANREIEIVLIIHHIITDKASLVLMLQWVSRRYGDLLGRGASSSKHNDESEAVSNPTKSNTYLEWASWLAEQKSQNNSILQPQMQKQEHIEFWKHHLQGLQRTPHLRGSSSNNYVGSPGSHQTIRIPPLDGAPGAKPKYSYSQRIAVAATALALRVVFDNPDVVLGLPYVNRDEPATADMLGFFLDRLPIRINLDKTDTSSASALLDAVSTEINLCLSNQLSYVEIQEAVGDSGNNHGHRAIIDVMVVYDWQSDSLEHSLSLGPDVRVVEVLDRVRPTGSLFPLEFGFFEEKDGGLRVHVTYNTEIVSPEHIAALIALLPNTLQRLAQQITPATTVASTASSASF
ncbi:non-ribosomal peptide synthetase [Xylariaceae sp. FL1651]|nr:non-ribosomal peptide synthetase [Xylariaceae sp. FL1651]